jgi:hypothetical protein
LKTSLIAAKEFLAKHERIVLPAALLFGFAVDAITLRRADLLPETILVYAYLAVSGLMIFLIHLAEAGKLRGSFFDSVRPFFPIAGTYAFGGLFSAFVIFYTKSALISDSWPFILALVAAVLALEFLREYRSKLFFNLTLYYLALFSFFIYSVPIWIGRMGTDVFFISTASALTVFALFCAALFISGKTQFKRDAARIAAPVIGVTVALIFFYSANILPPIPLVLKEIGPYYHIVRDVGGYTLFEEPGTFLRIYSGGQCMLFRMNPCMFSVPCMRLYVLPQ